MSLSNKLAITDVDLKGKRVLIRVSQRYQPAITLTLLCPAYLLRALQHQWWPLPHHAALTTLDPGYDLRPGSVFWR